MKTSSNNLRYIDHCLRGAPQPTEQVLFQARRLVDPDFDSSVRLQQRCYDFIEEHGRSRVRLNIAAADQQIFASPEHRTWRARLRRLFR